MTCKVGGYFKIPLTLDESIHFICLSFFPSLFFKQARACKVLIFTLCLL